MLQSLLNYIHVNFSRKLLFYKTHIMSYVILRFLVYLCVDRLLSTKLFVFLCFFQFYVEFCWNLGSEGRFLEKDFEIVSKMKFVIFRWCNSWIGFLGESFEWNVFVCVVFFWYIFSRYFWGLGNFLKCNRKLFKIVKSIRLSNVQNDDSSIA